MPLKKKPFVSYTLDEDKKNPQEAGKVFTIRLNAKEYRELREDMAILNIPREGTAYKFIHDTGRNVLHNTFGATGLKKIFNPRRIKEEIETVKKSEIPQNVTQN